MRKSTVRQWPVKSTGVDIGGGAGMVIGMTTLDGFAAGRLAELDLANLRRTPSVSQRTSPGTIRRGGRDLISFACNDYLNLSHHHEVRQAANAATMRYGTGAGASRLVTGDHPLFRELEERLAERKKTQDAVIFGSGYLANAGVIPALVGKPDLVLADRLSHASILDGARLSGATLHRFRHNDCAHAEALLREHRGTFGNCLIVTETVFSMDGDRAPLAELARLAESHGSWLMTDDAHGLGLLDDCHDRSPLQLGTLSKTLGSYGAYLCGSTPVCDLVRTTARSFIYSTGLPPACVAAALKSLELIEAHPEWGAQALAKAGLFAETLGLPPSESAIVPVILGSAERALDASRLLEEAGYLAIAIRPPTVPPGTARLRFTFSPAHRDEDVIAAATLVKRKIRRPA